MPGKQAGVKKQRAMNGFPTRYDDISAAIGRVNPVAYEKTRNHFNGAVSRLSPYISRGVIGLPDILSHILKRYDIKQSYKFIQELAWREYWQRTWEARGDDIWQNLLHEQAGSPKEGIPSAVVQAATGIHAVDTQLKELTTSGYLHNHARMYIASVVCNMARCNWRAGAAWMYHQLLDGDIASNALSWQWVAGTNASKKYYATQDNINTYSGILQTGTFLDTTYEELTRAGIPAVLEACVQPELACRLPVSTLTETTAGKIFIYNSYQLDPLWHAGEPGLRVLLFEPEHFRKFPVSDTVIRFILALSENIPGMRVFTGYFSELAARFPEATIYYKKHPSCTHYRGIADEPAWLFPGTKGYFRSFSAYWKKAEKELYHRYSR